MPNIQKNAELIEEAHKLLREAKRNIGRAWRIKEEIYLMLKRTWNRSLNN